MAFDQLYMMDTTTALSMDALKSTHPIQATIYDPATISQLFDAISYNKGASVIRMLQVQL